MSKDVKILRRIKKDDKYVEVKEKAELIKVNEHSFLVRLANGDIIKRKKRDVILPKEERG